MLHSECCREKENPITAVITCDVTPNYSQSPQLKNNAGESSDVNKDGCSLSNILIKELNEYLQNFLEN